MSAPVDVLVINTAHLREIARSNSHTAKTNALRNAANEIDILRAAVAKLIEADVAYDKAYAAAVGNPANEADLAEAEERRASALARVKGGAA